VERTARLALLAAGSGLVAALVAQRARAGTGARAADAGGVLEDITVTARRLTQGVLPRGIRLNNPGNIRRGRSNWQGMAAAQLDPDYVTFEAPKWGIRALARLLKNYQASGRKTVRDMINRWAPPAENDTGAYVRHVSQLLGVKPDDALAWPAQLAPMVAAIIRHENGFNPYTSTEMAEGIKLA
jgi:hypothetical protein